ncbi:hypothetical protein PoB_000606700 [Plakobranchus ocellatus]|uniref:Uncharacterized protein n=1 Tax=Plakobranchus ocellatus TaxID=259542 RepID=A0AAV3Y9T8_9GAST|nr:hypothetical protein PoB_000606700 [Plakobranchus ocellatus]
MSKLSMRGGYAVMRINGSLQRISGASDPIFFNNTLIEVRLHDTFQDSELNELLYVIIVIVFYATALMTLIITQIKRQRREGTEVDYYDEYLQRNSEVKQTCQTATSIVSRQGMTKSRSKSSSGPPPRALATAAFAAAAAGTLLGKTPYIPNEDAAEDSTLLSQSGNGSLVEGADVPGQTSVTIPISLTAGGKFSAEAQAVNVNDGAGAESEGERGIGEGTRSGGLGLGPIRPVSFGSPRLLHSRDRSPMLESIPDEEV